jgi:signal transduction histidine kinase
MTGKKSTGNNENRFLWIFTAWTLFALFMLLQSYIYRTRVGQSINYPILLVGEFSYAWLWCALTPLVLWLSRRFRIEKKSFFPNVAIHAVASLLFSVFHKAVSGAIYEFARSLQGSTFSWENPVQGVLAYMDYGILIYWIILLLKYSLDYYSRYHDSEVRSSRLEAQLSRAQLEALRMQLHPHFLFNTLNAVSVLIDRDPEGARATIGRLSDLLRLTLEYDGVQEVPLDQEIDFLERYLAIEKTRFGDRLTVGFQIAPDTVRAAVPAMILQPLVENAIKHGINRQRGPGMVEVSSSRGEGVLRLSVRDNGAGLRDQPGRKGVGLTNTRERLEKMYGSDFLLEIKNNDGGGVTAVVEIPFRQVRDTVSQ